MISESKVTMHGLTGNQLKLIAAITMLVDHIGVELFPQESLFRIIGRLSFPIFSYFIYEGYRYTRSRIKYFLRLLAMGLMCVAGYYIWSGEVYFNVLITFSLSALILNSPHFAVDCSKNGKAILISILPLLLCICGVGVFCSIFSVDYGFAGVILPAFAALFDVANGNQANSRIPSAWPLIGFSGGLLLLSLQSGGNQYFSLLSLLLLSLYNGNRGKWHMKQFFYWFYPVHLIAIGAVSYLLWR